MDVFFCYQPNSFNPPVGGNAK